MTKYHWDAKSVDFHYDSQLGQCILSFTDINGNHSKVALSVNQVMILIQQMVTNVWSNFKQVPRD